MAITRRGILTGIAAAAAAIAQQQPPGAAPPAIPPMPGAPDGPRVPRPRTPPKARTTPAVCLYSQHLIKVEYEAVGMVLRDLGFDGCNLAVVPGSHIPPEQAGSDLMRGIEAIAGVGLDVPIITTNVISANDPYGRQVLSIAGFMGVGLFRPGDWKWGNAPDLEARQTEVQRDLLQLASIARAYNVAMAVHNGTAESAGASVWDVNGMLRGIDPRWVGHDFDPGYATENLGASGAALATRLVTSKLKAVTVRDFTWGKDAAGAAKAAACPLGEGVVDWKTFFAALARIRYVGPVTIEVRYDPKDEINAFRKDLDFVRKQIASAYAG
ncbi:MAG: TIM barrel protein [Candidatus Solibacter sp.]